MVLVNLAKFVLGVSLAIAILIGGSAIGTLYFMYTVASRPPKPTFTNERVASKAQPSPSATPSAAKPVAPTQSSPQPTATQDSSPEPLEPGTYRARVNWEQGLSLRAEPNFDAERTGGLEYNQQIVVLEESADKNWQKVRLADGEQEGWIKAGNIERVQ
jgi:cytoskeletal protein RodZ